MLKGITVEEYGEVMKREGFDDGKAAGLAEGEKIKTLEMAKAMKIKKYADDEIAELTGLSKEKIAML